MSASELQWVPPPLERPEEQIRLLSKGSAFCWSLETWDMSSLPEYAPLSYVWGSDEPKMEVTINGNVVRVTANCSYALKQLRELPTLRYFWIDAICINQKNESEKSKQVQMMAEIYARGVCTVISLGEHDTQSKCLFRAVKKRQVLKQDFESNGSDEEKFRWFSSLDTMTSKELLEAYQRFSYRPYWSRLWVYQEMLKSTHLFLMCADEALFWEHLCELVDEMKDCSMMMAQGYTLRGQQFDCAHMHEELYFFLFQNGGTIGDIDERRRAIAMGNHPPDLFILLDSIKERKCFDPRDMIYGVLSLLQQDSNRPGLLVDYKRSKFQVAVEALKRCPLETSARTILHAQLLIKLLQIQVTDEGVRACAFERARVADGTFTFERIRQADEAASHSADDPKVIVRVEHRKTSPIHQSSDEAWQIHGKLDGRGWRRDRITQGEQSGIVQRCLPSDNKSYVYDAAIPLKLDSQVVGFTSGNCEVGDILVEMAKGHHRYHLSLRRHSESLYQIVGQAVLDDNVIIDLKSQDVEDSKDFELHFDAEDLLILLLDHIPQTRKTVWNDAALARTMLSPVKSITSSYAVAVEPAPAVNTDEWFAQLEKDREAMGIVRHRERSLNMTDQHLQMYLDDAERMRSS